LKKQGTIREETTRDEDRTRKKKRIAVEEEYNSGTYSKKAPKVRTRKKGNLPRDSHGCKKKEKGASRD